MRFASCCLQLFLLHPVFSQVFTSCQKEITREGTTTKTGNTVTHQGTTTGERRGGGREWKPQTERTCPLKTAQLATPSNGGRAWPIWFASPQRKVIAA
jgi:hypothetical protein